MNSLEMEESPRERKREAAFLFAELLLITGQWVEDTAKIIDNLKVKTKREHSSPFYSKCLCYHENTFGSLEPMWDIVHDLCKGITDFALGIGECCVQISPPDSKVQRKWVGNESRAASTVIELKAGWHQCRHLSNYRQAKVFTIAVQAMRRWQKSFRPQINIMKENRLPWTPARHLGWQLGVG